jgi:hypothetical protein
MRNTSPINYFPPTLFSPKRSPIYEEEHFFSQAGWVLTTRPLTTGLPTVDLRTKREREEIPEFLSKNSWRTRDDAARCVRAVAVAIKRFHARLAKAVNVEGRPHPVLQGFARHLREHLLIPSGRGGSHGGARAGWSGAGCFTYEPPAGVVWNAECGVRNAEHPTSNIEHPTSSEGRRGV